MLSSRVYCVPNPILRAVIVALSVFLFVICTFLGIGLRPDSVIYLGLWEEGRQQGPLYAQLIDIASIFGSDVEVVAWYVNLILLLITVNLLFSELVRNGVDQKMAALGVVVIIFLPQFMYVHATVLSEPLYFALFLGVLALVSRTMEGAGIWICVAAGVVAGLSVLTRFSGIPIIAAGGLSILVYGCQNFKRRLSLSVLFSFTASVIFLGWLLYDRAGGGEGVGRQIAFLGDPDWATFIRGLNTISAFFVPSAIAIPIRAFVFVLAMLSLLFLIYYALKLVDRESGNRTPAIARVAMMHVVTYAPFLILTLFMEFGLGIHSRYLVPVYIAACIALLTMFCRSSEVLNGDLGYRVAMVVMLALLASNVVRGSYSAYKLATKGNYFKTAEWLQSPTLLRVGALDPDVKIYSNGPDAIRLLLRRKAYFWPRLYDSRTGVEHPLHPFDKEMAQLAREVADGSAVVVGFDNVDWRAYLATEEQLVNELDLPLVNEESDGRIYGIDSNTKSDG